MSDVFPRRNLSPDAEPWGREVERSLVNLEGVAAATKSGVKGQNRTTAANLGDLTRQLERIDALYRAIPKPRQATSTNTGFGLSGGWNTIALTSVVVPEDATNANVFVVGSGFLTNTVDSLVGGLMRLTADGNASPAQPYATYSDVGGFHASLTPGYSWTLNVTPGATFLVSMQMSPEDAATWGAHGNNYATVAIMVTFTG